jgi:hypothetical protein
MDFNHDSGDIVSVLSLDTTQAPPLGGSNVLTIIGNGAVAMPSGTTAERPVSPVAGYQRWNTTIVSLEFFDGTSWLQGSGSVSSVAVASNSSALTVVSGSPITTTGTITLDLDADLTAIAAVAGTGLLVRTGSGTFAARTIQGTAGNITLTNGDGVAGNPVVNLETVGTPVAAFFGRFTTDAFGRVTATAAATSGDITTALGYTPVNKAGDTMTGSLSMGNFSITDLATPVVGTDAVNKNYVDAAVTGLSWKQAVRAATTVAGTLTTDFENGDTIDGVVLATGDRILIKDQGDNTENGIYTVNVSGAPTRSDDANLGTELVGAAVYIDQGTVNADTGWSQQTASPLTIGSSALVFTQFSGSGTYTAGTGLQLTGNTFSLITPVSVANGGTGSSTLGGANTVLGVNAAGTATEYKTVTAGTGISVVHGAGSITINNTGVTSVAVASNSAALTVVSGSPITTTGTITLDLDADLTAIAGVGTNGFLVRTGAGTYDARTLTAGTGISITNADGVAGNPTINNTGVTSVALSAPSIFSVAGSPVTTTGTLALSLVTQSANTVFAGPSSGGAATPTFRTLTYADLPLQLYRENPSSPTVPSATGTNAVAIGSGSTASGTATIAVGSGSNATFQGAVAFANGQFATAGDAQMLQFTMRNTTTNNTVTELFVDGTSLRAQLPANGNWNFEIQLSARRTDATGGNAGYRFEGVIIRDAANASTAFIGSPSKTVLGETNASWNANVVADTTNGALRIDVTCETGKTVRWVASVRITQVTN